MSSTMEQTKDKAKSSTNLSLKQKTSTTTELPWGSKEELTDVYTLSPDLIWKAAILKERQLARSWRSIWGPLMIDEQYGKHVQQRHALRNVKPPTGREESVVPTKLIVHLQSLEIMDRQKIPQVRFNQEQYGYYRELKYLKQGRNKVVKDESSTPFSKQKHYVKPLLC